MINVKFGFQNLVNIVLNATSVYLKMEESIGIVTNVEDVLRARGNIATSVEDVHYQNIHASFILKPKPRVEIELLKNF